MPRVLGIFVVVVAVTLGPLTAGARAADTVALGAAGSFGVLAATSVPNTGASVINGDLGVSAGALSGFPPGTVGSGHGMHVNDELAVQAHADLAAAYAAADRQAQTAAIAGDLGGTTLGPGVHVSPATIAVTGEVTLDAGGDPNAVFILRAASTLDSNAGSNVLLAGGAQACNVFWQVGTDTTLGADSQLAGTILATGAITLGARMAIAGRALSRDSAVTMDAVTVTLPACGPRSLTAPTITPFTAALTGAAKTLHTEVGEWSVNDPTGSNAGYRVTAAATEPTVDGSEAKAGTGGSLTLTAPTPTAADGNPATTGPVPASPQVLGTSATTIATAVAGTGQGRWNFAAHPAGLDVVIPGDAAAGAYSSTLTFTTAPAVGE